MTLFDNAHTIYHLYPNITRYISEPLTDFLYRYDFSIKDITVSNKIMYSAILKFISRLKCLINKIPQIFEISLFQQQNFKILILRYVFTSNVARKLAFVSKFGSVRLDPVLLPAWYAYMLHSFRYITIMRRQTSYLYSLLQTYLI